MSARSSKPSGPVRRASVAGLFYPGDAAQLRRAVNEFMNDALAKPDALPKAVIAPHAGYAYSGPIAGTAFAPLTRARDIRRVVLLGPSHFEPFEGLALPRAVAFETPLGQVPVDTEACAQLRSLSQVRELDAAHGREHSLEVELPFLQLALGEFKLVPLTVRDASDEEVGEVLDLLWGGPETLFVISSDLSHYLDYHSACEMDRQTADAIEHLNRDAIAEDRACGANAIRGLLWAAQKRGLRAQTLDLRNSGDTAGRRDRVVGYGAFALVASG